MSNYTATYSPEDNKLRLYSMGRLPKDLYTRVRGAGFIWAPKQELFVAPMWTPDREDLLLELCDEVGDEDTTLTERQEQRAERFEDYSSNRKEDAESAHKAVSAIADGIPLGQPILVGHHSERHARRDAEKIENGMRRAIKMWETSEYWTERAKGAIRHAKYKERPDVRARRIKKIEADRRKILKRRGEHEKFLKTYNDPEAQTAKYKNPYDKDAAPIPLLHALLGTYEGGLSFEDQSKFSKGEFPFDQAFEKAKRNLQHWIDRNNRWIDHYDHRLTYEKAMLAADGGTAADQVVPEVGGGCKCWCGPRNGYAWIVKVNKVSVSVWDNYGNGGKNFLRTVPFDKLYELQSAATVQAARASGSIVEFADKTGFALLDEKPAPKGWKEIEADPDAAKFKVLKANLEEGIQVVSAPNLFPTPPQVAIKMIELADLCAGDRVLEPSAGTGNLCKVAIAAGVFKSDLVAVEVNSKLAEGLKAVAGQVIAGDFLEQNGNLGKFDRVLMNPPFDHGSDIKHILHARGFLNPGGKIIAICANGPKQKEAFLDTAIEWMDLDPGTFEGTNVRAAIIVIEAKK